MKMSGEKAIHRQELERGLLTQKISRLFLKGNYIPVYTSL